MEKADAQGLGKKARADVAITSKVASPPLLTEVSAIITAIAAGGKPKDLLAKVDLSADAKWVQFVETAISLPDSHMLLTALFDEFTQPPPPYWESPRRSALAKLVPKVESAGAGATLAMLKTWNWREMYRIQQGVDCLHLFKGTQLGRDIAGPLRAQMQAEFAQLPPQKVPNLPPLPEEIAKCDCSNCGEFVWWYQAPTRKLFHFRLSHPVSLKHVQEDVLPRLHHDIKVKKQGKTRELTLPDWAVILDRDLKDRYDRLSYDIGKLQEFL